uniref:Uncharacterized protein n=1 Tax=viral metagenome TaxID=1070528 RepID=A0A6C0DYI0_9ZZZZ
MRKGVKTQPLSVLPEEIIESRLYMNETLRSWIHYIQLRTTKRTPADCFRMCGCDRNDFSYG